MTLRADAQIVNGMQMLIVDDNATSLHILKETVANWGVQPTTADSEFGHLKKWGWGIVVVLGIQIIFGGLMAGIDPLARAVACIAAAVAMMGAAASAVELPLHARIDKLIAAKAGGPVNPPATDAEFIRRIYLDFAGRIPTIEETREFLAENSADKRIKLIDKLLASKDYPRRMQELFHVMLMERRGDHDDWTKFLRKSFEANKPWDQIVREILNPNADDEATRGAAFFYTKRLEKYGQNPTDYPGLVRDVGRLFMGVDVQCHVEVCGSKGNPTDPKPPEECDPSVTVFFAGELYDCVFVETVGQYCAYQCF